MKPTILFYILAVFTLASCIQSPEPGTKEQKAITATLENRMRNYCRDIKATGLTAEFKYLDSSSHFFWVPPGYTSPISYDSVKKILTRNAPMFKLVDNSYETLRIIPLSRELASYTAKINSIMTDTSGKTTKYKLIETGVLIKRKEGWKLLNGQTSLLKN